VSDISVEVVQEPQIAVTIEDDCDIVLQVPTEQINLTIQDESPSVQVIEEPAINVSVEDEVQNIVTESEATPTIIEVAPVSGGGGGGTETYILEAGETLSAGNFVNIYQEGPTTKVRKADASLGRQADGFVKSVVTAGQPASVYTEGINDQLFGLSAPQRYYLGVLGNVTSIPPAKPGSLIHQFLGVAISATTLKNETEDLIDL
jgi:hypothetical protein